MAITKRLFESLLYVEASLQSGIMPTEMQQLNHTERTMSKKEMSTKSEPAKESPPPLRQSVVNKKVVQAGN